MNLRNRHFERATRRLAKPLLKRSPALWKEYRQTRFGWRDWDSTFVRQWTRILLVMAFLQNVPRSAGLGLSVTLLGLATVLAEGRRLSMRLHAPAANVCFAHLPFADRINVREALKRTVWSSLSMIVAIAAALAMMIPPRVFSPYAPALVAAGTVVMWLGCWTGVVMLGRLPWLYRLQRPLWIQMGLFFGAFFTHLLPADKIAAAQYALAFTPPGSVVYAFMEYSATEALPVWPVAVAVAYVGLAPFAVSQLFRSYTTLPVTWELFEGPALVAEMEATVEEQLQPVAGERLVYQLLNARVSRDLLWLDRWSQRLFSPRDHLVYRFMSGGGSVESTRLWYIGSIVALLCLALTLSRVPAAAVWGMGILAFSLSLPLLGGYWAGFERRFSSSQLTPMYAFYPIGFREVTRVLLKVNLTRTLAWTPGIAVVCLAIGRTLDASLSATALIAIELLFGLLCFQPLAVVTRFSMGDAPKGWSWKRLGVMVVHFASFLGFLAAWAGLLLGGLLAKAFCAIGMPVAAMLCFEAYRIGHERGHWDLLRSH